jgi:hypothetical protein
VVLLIPEDQTSPGRLSKPVEHNPRRLSVAMFLEILESLCQNQKIMGFLSNQDATD